MKKEVKFVFDNAETAEHFLSWLCDQGEQDYWEWMRCREDEEKGPITAVKFDYHGGTMKGSEFGKHPIVCESGRLDEPDNDNGVIDETEDDEDVNDDGTKTCHHCKQTMSWSPSGFYCGDTNCRGFQDDGTTC